MPVYPTMAARFDDPGVSRLYLALLAQLEEHGWTRESTLFDAETLPEVDPAGLAIVPPNAPALPRRDRRAPAATTARGPRTRPPSPGSGARPRAPEAQVEDWAPEDRELLASRLDQMAAYWWDKLDPRSRAILENWDALAEQYTQDEYVYHVRGQGNPPAALPRDAERARRCRAWRCRGPRPLASGSASRSSKTCPASSPSPPASSRSSARARTPRGCSPARARPSGPTAASTSSASGLPGEAPLHRLRQRHALRARPRPAARHLRQGRHLWREHLHAGRHEEALLRLRPRRADDERVA